MRKYNKTGGPRRSVLLKLLAVLLYILCIPAAFFGFMLTIEFTESNMYTGNPEKIYEERIEEMCIGHIHEVFNAYHDMTDNGYYTDTISAQYKQQLHDDMMALHDPSKSNFEFVISDAQENVLMQNFSDGEYRFSRTEAFYDTVIHTEKFRMSAQEWEKYTTPPNADVSVEEVWIEERIEPTTHETTLEPSETTLAASEAPSQDPITGALVETTSDPTETAVTVPAASVATENGTTDAGIADLTENVPEYREVLYYDVTVHIPESTITQYITGYVRSELTANDSYAKFDKYFSMIYQYRYAPMIVLGISIIVFLLTLSYLLYAAGYRKYREKPTASIFDKIPFDVFTFILIMIIMFVLLFVDEFAGQFSTILDIGIICSGLIILGLTVLWWLMSLTVRIRTRSIIRNNLIVILWKKFWGMVGNTVKELQKLPILWQVPLFALGFFLLNIFGMTMIVNNNEMLGLMLMILTYTSMIIVICLAVANLHLLEQGAEKIASGDLSYKIPTEKLIGAFKKHGEHLNSIGDGMNHAVSERMKSEMFKTELIANVSHDIRTPLTSIINYTDLLSKLELENPQAREYLEVLTRQSARLRKLTEDVLEASKATTGNMKVQPEKMDLRVLVEQILGEYEEKLDAKSLQVVCNMPDTPIHIMADGRLMWRVMDNLFANVCKYAMQNTRVYLDASVNNGQAELTLRNISSVQLHISADELMERFVQGDRSRNTEGSGLGLSIAQSLTALQGGQLELNIDGDLFKVKLTFTETA